MIKILNNLITATTFAAITATGAYLCYNLVVIGGYAFLTLLNTVFGIS